MIDDDDDVVEDDDDDDDDLFDDSLDDDGTEDAEANTASEDVSYSMQVVGSTDVNCSAAIYFSTGVRACAAVLFCVDVVCKQYMFCNREYKEKDWYKKLEEVTNILKIPAPDSEISFDEFGEAVTPLIWFELLEVDGVDSVLLSEVSGIDEDEILAMAGMGFQQKLISIGAVFHKDECD
jgi:hypothetical protein